MLAYADPKRSYLEHRYAIGDAILAELEAGQYILGESVERFEEEFADFCSAGYAIGVNSGTDALAICLMACDVGPGDEVIVPGHTAPPTVSAVKQVGATPVFVDITATCLIDIDRIEEAITPQTRAIIPVHLYGCPVDMSRMIRVGTKHGIKIIEDCAQAVGSAWFGSPAGSWGDMAAFSFYPTKNLGALGDGGAVVTSDLLLAERAIELRQYGWEALGSRSYQQICHDRGINSRLDSLQAAILRVKLSNIKYDLHRRRIIARTYRNYLLDTSYGLPSDPPGGLHSYNMYVIATSDRDNVRRILRERGIHCGVHYYPPVATHPAFWSMAEPIEQCLDWTWEAAGTVLSLPMFPQLTEEEQDMVIQALYQADPGG